MKTRQQVLAAITNRLMRSWAEEIISTGSSDDWPAAVSLGEVKSAELESAFTHVLREADSWQQWATERSASLRWKDRRVSGAMQQLPSHVLVPTVDEAARLAGAPWPSRLARGRSRAATLASQFPDLTAQLATIVRDADRLSDHDFQTLCAVGEWFRLNGHLVAGLTPRQVPVPGVQAKWLNTTRGLVATLAGLGSQPDLGLLPPHPPRIHFTYLPQYLAGGARRYDSATVGDRFQPAYRPRVVIISENKDTSICFPAFPDAISVEGVGKGGGTIAAFHWIHQAETLAYWGDMDPDGLEILNGFRAAGVPARGLLMDPIAYGTWERYGTNTDAAGEPLKPKEPRATPYLTDDERCLYESLCSPAWTRYRRVEQERIPLHIAAAELAREASADRGR